MARLPVLTYDRGTLLLHPPPRGKGWMDYATWDDRVERFRLPASAYCEVLACLESEGCRFDNQAAAFTPLSLIPAFERQPYRHQQEALHRWQAAQHRGVVVLPTAAGKTYLAQMALQAVGWSSLIVVPTLELLHQWYHQLLTLFPAAEVGLLGGGSRDQSSLLVATYDSAAIHAEFLGNRYALLIFDECHHLPSDFYRVTAEYAIAPYRLGLTATPERSDGRHQDLITLIGQEVYRKTAVELAGYALAEYEVIPMRVTLSEGEQAEYRRWLAIRNQFLQQSGIRLGQAGAWQQFIRVSGRSAQGRQAMLAHHQAKGIAQATSSKLRILRQLLIEHHPQQILIFAHDQATVYHISTSLLIPAITHQTPVKERQDILTRFRAGEYTRLVAANVLDEGVDVPEVKIAIWLAGSGSPRQFIQRLGRILRRSASGQPARLYELISQDTLEEGISQRRHGQTLSPYPRGSSFPSPPTARAAEQPDDYYSSP
ncbi:MAG: DEAD/DEAH box helicase family protein [Cyanobacteriota bacterium]|nr:DEAD/DEAH box helicase family protein [Cyanobacteriota bacterium]